MFTFFSFYDWIIGFILGNIKNFIVVKWILLLVNLLCPGSGFLPLKQFRVGFGYFLFSAAFFFVLRIALSSVSAPNTICFLLAAAIGLIIFTSTLHLAAVQARHQATWFRSCVTLIIAPLISLILFNVNGPLFYGQPKLSLGRSNSNSMTPTFSKNSILLFRWEVDPSLLRNKIIMFNLGSSNVEILASLGVDSNHTLNVKRVVGLPGDYFTHKDGILTIKPRITQSTTSFSSIASLPDFSGTIGPREVFVLGDNITSSIDSRVYGPVPLKEVKAVGIRILYPNPALLFR